MEIEFYVLCVCYAYKLLFLAQELPFTCPILFSKAISDNFKNNGSSTWNFEPNSEKFALACRSSKVAAIFDPLSHAEVSKELPSSVGPLQGFVGTRNRKCEMYGDATSSARDRNFFPACSCAGSVHFN